MVFGLLLVLGTWGIVFSIPFIIGKAVSEQSYAHACDSDWLQVVLTGHTYEHAAQQNVATFSVVETGETLWTWTSNDPLEDDFNLAGFNSTTPSLLPTLSNITIDNRTNEISRAWCRNSTKQCATGYVWPFDGLSFEVQFNGTITRMRNRYDYWSFDNLPSVIMHRVDENGQLGERLLQTSVESPKTCGQLKVCVSHAMRRREGLVDPDVLVAIGWLLEKVVFHRTHCT